MENNTTLEYLEEEAGEKMIVMEFICEVVLMIIVGVFGLIGNTLSIIMFSRLKKKQLKFHRLMILLALFDTAYILLNILVFVVPGISESYKNKGYHYLFAPTVMPITQIALTGSVYCTIAISIERYLTVCHPFYTASKNWSAKRYIFPIILFSIIYNLPRFFELRWKLWGESQIINGEEVISYENATYFIELTELRKNEYYYCSILILNIILMGIGPFIILFLLTSLTLRSLLIYSRQDNVISTPPLLNMYIASNSTLATTNNDPLLTTTNDTFDTIQLRHTEHAALNGALSPHPSPCSSIPRSSIVTNHHMTSRSSVATPFSVTKRLKTNEIMLSKVSMMISVMFIICHSIRFVPNIYELIARFHINQGIDWNLWPDWIECFTFISHLLTVLSASINFYIYYFARYKIKSMNCLSECCSTKESSSPTIRLMQL